MKIPYFTNKRNRNWNFQTCLPKFIIVLIISLALVVPANHVSAQLVDIGGLIDRIGDALDNLLDSKSFDRISDSKCLSDGLVGGPSDVKKKGHLIIGTPCSDKIKGDGDDEIIYTLGGVDRVFAGKGNDIIYGGLGDNRLYGERDDDIIIPGGGSNLVDGGPGNDVLFGGIGNNLLLGGDGNDQLIAGLGVTIMDGGAGSNGFDCGPSSIVLDYNPDNGDTIAGKCKVVNNIGIKYPTDTDFVSDPDDE